MCKEIWKDIEGYEGLYQVSNLGRVKSLSKKRGFGEQKEKVLKPWITNLGYCTVTLYKNSLSQIKRVHRLVAEAYIPNPENKETVNHIDGNKQNNTVENLEWNTQSENINHSIKTGLVSHSPYVSGAKLNKTQIQEIRNIHIPYDKKTGTRALARKYNVDPSTISKIINMKSYK